MTKLVPKTVSYLDLMLDPNNPRLSRNFSTDTSIQDEDIEEVQDRLTNLFDSPELNHRDEFTDIRDLKHSMKQIGFVGIQNILVRKISGKRKYLVIEGNRRVASIKALIRDHDAALPGTPARIGDDTLESLLNIKVMVIPTKGVSEKQIQNNISTALGLRHIGGHLEWEPLPKGRNIFLEYMKHIGNDTPFKWEYKIGHRIADILAIDRGKVKISLCGYICYTEIGNADVGVKPHHYSLILSCISNKHLKNGFLDIDTDTFVFLGDTLDNLNKICEFSDRDNRDGSENILRDPKSTNRLGLIYKDSLLHESQSIKDMASGLFNAVVDKEISLSEATSTLTAFKKRHQWVQSIDKLLEKQSNEPNLANHFYLPRGETLRLKVELQRLIERYLLIMDI